MSLLTCEWRKLAFANYIVPTEVVEKHLPPHTKIDFYNGNCFLSLVGFQFKNVKVAGAKMPFHTDFEEINLRFYVRRFDGQQWRKGTVFISEIVGKPALSVLANSVFNENYQTLPTRQEVTETTGEIQAGYSLFYDNHWHHLKVHCGTLASPVAENSESEFIIHRLWGYGTHNHQETNEYKILHPAWPTYEVREYSVDVDFAKVFGPEFSMLTSATPHSVILAEGSSVTVEDTNRIS